jgi:hypothetical protein
MFARTLKLLLGFFVIGLFFTACGDMGTAFSSGGGTTYYRVNAMVNKSTLYEYSVIKKNDQVHPYFVNSVDNDPDILGLTVFWETPTGKIVSPKVQYTRKAEENLFENIYIPEAPPEASPPDTTEPSAETGEPDINEAPPVETGTTEETGESPPESGETGLVPLESVQPEPVPQETPPPEPVSPEPVLPEPVPPEPVQPEPVSQAALPPEPVQGEETPVEDVPELPPPEENPDGEASGDETPPETPSGEGDLPEEPVTEEKPPEPVSQPEKKQDVPLWEEVVFYVTNLDWQLPAFPIPENLEIGQYVMVFQVIGTQNALYEIDLPFYFLGDAAFNLEDIRSYLPSVSPGTYLISPGEYIMLEALVESDPRLDPYLVWYSNKRRIGEGRLSDKANYLFWEAPEKTGFQSITVEVFPFAPTAQIKGMVKELSLPISKKHAARGAFSQTADQYALWYRFEGNLSNVQAPADSLKSLVAYQGSRAPQWLPWAGIYGLSVGPGDMYQLPGSPFVLTEGEQGTGRLIFRVKLLADGTIFKASFKASRSSVDILDLNLSCRGTTLILTVKEVYKENSTEEAKTYEERINLQPSLMEDFFALFIDFGIGKNRFTFQMGIEDAGIAGEEKIVPLTTTLNGTGVFQFGDTLPVSAGNSRRNTPNAGQPVFILDELGVLYTRGPAVMVAEETIAADQPELSAKTENL